MKICIDISQIPYGTGVSVYTKQLVKNLLKIDKKNEYMLFAGYLRRKKDFQDFYKEVHQENVTLKLVPFPPKVADFFWNRFHIIKVERFVGEIDIFHSSDWSQPPTDAKLVTTVHDLTPVLFPKETPSSIYKVHKRKLYWVKREANLIITPSNSTKNDLVNLGIDESFIHVVPEAPDSALTPSSKGAVSNVKKRLRINGDYLLAVGTAHRKNLHRIVDAYERVKAELGISQLVVVGQKPADQHKRGVNYVGRVDKSTLAALYTGSKCLVYASLYEGFGLPILEAFACGCPVVASNTSSIPEVAGDAAILVDPESIESISGGVKKIMKSSRKYVHKGKKRANKFSWKKNAVETLELYKKLV